MEVSRYAQATRNGRHPGPAARHRRDHILYQVGEGIDLSDLSPGQQVTVRYEPSDMPTTPLATEIIAGAG